MHSSCKVQEQQAIIFFLQDRLCPDTHNSTVLLEGFHTCGWMCMLTTAGQQLMLSYNCQLGLVASSRDGLQRINAHYTIAPTCIIVGSK
jgi:hypothetical protein